MEVVPKGISKLDTHARASRLLHFLYTVSDRLSAQGNWVLICTKGKEGFL